MKSKKPKTKGRYFRMFAQETLIGLRLWGTVPDEKVEITEGTQQ